MKKIFFVFSLVIGLILSTNAIIHMNLMYSNANYKPNNVLGYATQIIIFSLIYFGVRHFRNNQLNGKISFLRAFKVGALICFLASTVYVVLGLSYYYLFAPDFLDVLSECMIKNSPVDKVEATTAQMTNFKEMYKNPLFAIFVSYMEVMPTGIIVALVSALIVKKK